MKIPKYKKIWNNQNLKNMKIPKIEKWEITKTPKKYKFKKYTLNILYYFPYRLYIKEY